QELESRHDAIFLGAGLGEDSKLNVPGEDLPGVCGAVEWIERMKLGSVSSEIAHCVVIGGGNTALDAVREARGLGIPHVTMLYRGVEEAMSGYQREWAAAKTEGVHALWRSVAVAFEGTGKLQRIQC